MNQEHLHAKGEVSRLYHSIFGMMRISRQKYYSEHTGIYYALDAQLNLPKARHSYLLQSWITRAASSEAFAPSLELLNEILGEDFKAMTAQRIAQRYGQQVEAYYQHREPLEAAAEGAILAVSFDGKGVPIIKSERQGTEEEPARLMKGQKRGIKRQATVSVSFSFDPALRSPEEVAKSLHRRWSADQRAEHKQQENPRQGQYVHKRAFLGPQRTAIDYGLADIKARDPQQRKPIIALIDGDRGLVSGVTKAFSEAGLCCGAMILDIVHVSEYLWKAATSLLGETHPEREGWVYERLLLLLESQVDEVIGELAAIEAPSKAILSALRYFENHREMMDYKRYLSSGYPISTGLVESCCGHLVKDRMEGSGMRWSRSGAQHVLDIRAVNKNGDWEDFSGFVKEQGQPLILKHAA